jgi:uncharacterized YigZ family protein
MKEKEFYLTIDNISTAEFKDRGSKFIAYAYPVATVEDFKKQLVLLKKEHPKAVHHCFAYRIGIGGYNYRVSDDGEPSGTAGRQILGQIDSRELTDVAIIVVRYFGGTLLGVPGLINAYKTAAALTLQIVPAIQKQIEVLYKIQFDYTQMNEVMTILKQFNCRVLNQQLQLFCMVHAGIAVGKVTEVVYRLKDIKGVEVFK